MLLDSEPSIKPETIPPVVLAYIGDAVYELMVREHLVSRGILKVNQLHQEAVKYVRATAQARILRSLEEYLTEVEKSVARRGRNARLTHVPRGAPAIDYRHSTGLECLMGFLYLKGDLCRLREIFRRVLEIVAFDRQELL